MVNNKCPKCGGEMELGVTHSIRGGINLWGTRGDKSWLVGGYKIENHKNIDTYRCKSCGFLESYAK